MFSLRAAPCGGAPSLLLTLPRGHSLWCFWCPSCRDPLSPPPPVVMTWAPKLLWFSLRVSLLLYGLDFFCCYFGGFWGPQPAVLVLLLILSSGMLWGLNLGWPPAGKAPSPAVLFLRFSTFSGWSACSHLGCSELSMLPHMVVASAGTMAWGCPWWPYQ